MTTCAHCLSELSTMRLIDMRAGSPVALHCASCSDCASVAQEIGYAERRLAASLAEARPGFTPEELAFSALDQSERLRRKTVGRWVSGLLAAAGCITFWFFMQNVFVPWTDGSNRTAMETITLRCLTADQASTLATRYLKWGGSKIYFADIHTITLKGRADDLVRARAEIAGVDNKITCKVPAADAAPSTSTDKPGKD